MVYTFIKKVIDLFNYFFYQTPTTAPTTPTMAQEICSTYINEMNTIITMEQGEPQNNAAEKSKKKLITALDATFSREVQCDLHRKFGLYRTVPHISSNQKDFCDYKILMNVLVSKTVSAFLTFALAIRKRRKWSKLDHSICINISSYLLPPDDTLIKAVDDRLLQYENIEGDLMRMGYGS